MYFSLEYDGIHQESSYCVSRVEIAGNRAKRPMCGRIVSLCSCMQYLGEFGNRHCLCGRTNYLCGRTRSAAET